MTKVLVDTCILVYMFDKSDIAKHTASVRYVDSLAREGLAVASIQNLAEFSRVMSEKSKPRVPHHQVHDMVDKICGTFHIVSYSSETVKKALLLSSTSGVPFFDALIICTMEENDVCEIATENEKDFAKSAAVSVTNPFKG